MRKNYIVLKLIMEAIITSLDLNDQERRNFDKNNYSHETKVIEFIVNFFNDRHGLKIKKHSHSAVEHRQKN